MIKMGLNQSFILAILLVCRSFVDSSPLVIRSRLLMMGRMLLIAIRRTIAIEAVSQQAILQVVPSRKLFRSRGMQARGTA